MSLINIIENDLQRYYDRSKNVKSEKKEDDVKVTITNNVSSNSLNIYYTMSIVNPVIYDPPNPALSVPKIAKLSFTRNSEILSNPDHFRVCVSRLSFPSASLPLFLYPEDITTYTITLSYVPTNPIQPVIQVTRDLVYVNPSVGDTYQEYRPVYYVQTLLDILNTAYTDAYNQIVADVIAIGENYNINTAPYLEYDQQSKLIKLFAEDTYSDITKRGIFMNKPLFDDFFSGLYSREVLTGVNQFNGVQLIVKQYTNNAQTIAGIDYLVMTEEFSSIPLFNKVDRIIVTSNMIPINNTSIATQTQQNIPVLLDYIIPDENLDRRRYEYNPTIYKWIDLTQTTSLRNFDIAFYILFEDGNIIPLKINANQRIDMTMLFVPKDTCYQ